MAPNVNQILTFGLGQSALVLNPASYAALPARTTGFIAGPADEYQVNTVLRQSAFMSATLAQFVADNANVSVLDNGDVTAVERNLEAAIKALVTPLIPAQVVTAGHSLVHRGTNGSDVNNLVADVDPAPGTYEKNNLYVIDLNGANTGQVTANFNGLGTKPVLRSSGTQLKPGDIKNTAILVDDGNAFVLANMAQEVAPPGSAAAGNQSRTSFFPVKGQIYALEQTIVAAFSGVVLCYSTLNTDFANGSFINRSIVTVNGTATQSAADEISGASFTTAIAKVNAGDAITFKSQIQIGPSNNVTTQQGASQYLNYVFIPA